VRTAERILTYGRLVRFTHTIFALPFAVMGAVLASREVHGRALPPLSTCLWILAAMVGARSAAMAMNRLADAGIDAENPRTKDRELPAGKVSRREVGLFLVGALALFVFACAMLNRLALFLSPIVIFVVLAYPYTKRFTSLCHVWLGIALGLSPVGAWVAVAGRFGEGFLAAFWLGAGVVLWTAGFDVIYALLDVEFDRKSGIYSLPAKLGAAPALAISIAFHVGTVALFVLAGLDARLGAFYYAGVGAVTALLVYEHSIVRPSDLSRVNLAFFTLNGSVSLVLMAALAADVLVAGPA
jgi:4-hydroxybenzoate polyprenyltransferase